MEAEEDENRRSVGKEMLGKIQVMVGVTIGGGDSAKFFSWIGALIGRLRKLAILNFFKSGTYIGMSLNVGTISNSM